MPQVNVTDLRQNLPGYLDQVKKGKELQITSHGKVIARIIPERDAQQAALTRIIALRNKCRIGDVVSPTGVQWDVEHGRS